MSSYFVNSISACYGPGAGLADHCLDPGYDRGVGGGGGGSGGGLAGYSSHGGVYPGYGSSKYYLGYSGSRGVMGGDPTGDYYSSAAAPRLSHPPSMGHPHHHHHHHPHHHAASPCGSPSDSGGNMSPTALTSPAPPSGGGGSAGGGEAGSGGSGVGDTSPRPSSAHSGGAGSPPLHIKQRTDQKFPPPQIYPWMRRMQYSGVEVYGKVWCPSMEGQQSIYTGRHIAKFTQGHSRHQDVWGSEGRESRVS
ncbi:hypothetical protein C0Q70_04285 [Pomacea canaliculata]|uniref:Homeobox domain-containing protein n=1 Tax=Pomacea canaliculata TaxID=400727 RepID=A0A2T7PV45_POMCA|nr:hypothetical protein C0Q70_04285 [Pomacea canaliculata]